ncbi:MAG: glutamate--tRNA ligase [Candidatus Micrarchaeia archaeon]
MLDETQKKEIKKIVLKNALDYGKARKDSVISKVIAKFPSLKLDMPSLSKYLDDVVFEVNKFSKQRLEEEAEEFKDTYKKEELEKAEKSSKHNFNIEGAEKGNFITRFPPEPNGPMQLGHAKVAFTEREFANVYEGKLALYFDDTNPETEKQEFVDNIKKDLKWLGINYDMEYYASDNIELIYKYCEKLIALGSAYACTCSQEDVKKSRSENIPCKHKKHSISENMDLWRELLKGINSSETIIRLNYDLGASNTSMRDPTLFRVKTATHYRQGDKYTVWPTYSFNTPITDSIKGVTDVIRSKEFELMDELYFYILEKLELRKPRIHSVARLEIKDNITSKRKINALIKEGLLWGYDDPRLVTIAGLRRRGVKPLAIKEFSLRFGMSKTESKVDISMLLNENKKIIENHAKRLFYVENPRKLYVKNIPLEKKKMRMKVHPTLDMGYRSYTLDNVFFINSYDANVLSENEDLRLKDAFDIKIENIDKNEIIATYTDKQSSTAPKVTWVNEGNFMGCTIYEIKNLLNGEEFNKNSMEIKEGLIESYADLLSEGDIVQLEKHGFFKLDKKTERPYFISL